MATKATDTDQVRRLRAQLRDAKTKGPLRSRLELAAKKGAPAFVGGGVIGYTEEMWGPERGAQVTAAMGLGGLAALVLLSPNSDSIVGVVLEGATASGMATMAREHGATLARYTRVKKAEAELRAEMAREPQAIDDVNDRETLDNETTTNNEERVTA